MFWAGNILRGWQPREASCTLTREEEAVVVGREAPRARSGQAVLTDRPREGNLELPPCGSVAPHTEMVTEGGERVTNSLRAWEYGQAGSRPFGGRENWSRHICSGDCSCTQLTATGLLSGSESSRRSLRSRLKSSWSPRQGCHVPVSSGPCSRCSPELPSTMAALLG